MDTLEIYQLMKKTVAEVELHLGDQKSIEVIIQQFIEKVIKEEK